MNRREFLHVATLTVLMPSAANAQQDKKIARIGYLSMASPEADHQWVAALREGLRDLGYIEGQNMILEQRHAYNDVAKVPALAAELVKLDMAVILVYGSNALPALKKAAGSLPIVMTVHADPVGSGVVGSLARPGGNITGLTDGHTELAPKRLELLKEVVPSVSRVGVLFNPSTRHAVRQWNLVQAAGPRLGVAIVPIEIRGAHDIEHAFDTMRKERLNGLVFAPDPSWWVGHEQRMADLAIKHRLPAIASVREFADNGILLAYGTNFVDLWRRSAAYVDKILKGANPGDLPIEHPTRFYLVLNLKTAKTLGLKISRDFLARADEVIE